MKTSTIVILVGAGTAVVITGMIIYRKNKRDEAGAQFLARFPDLVGQLQPGAATDIAMTVLRLGQLPLMAGETLRYTTRAGSVYLGVTAVNTQPAGEGYVADTNMVVSYDLVVIGFIDADTRQVVRGGGRVYRGVAAATAEAMEQPDALPAGLP